VLSTTYQSLPRFYDDLRIVQGKAYENKFVSLSYIFLKVPKDTRGGDVGPRPGWECNDTTLEIIVASALSSSSSSCDVSCGKKNMKRKSTRARRKRQTKAKTKQKKRTPRSRASSLSPYI